MFEGMFDIDMRLNRNEAVTIICILACMVIAAFFIAGALKGEINPSDLNLARFGGI